MKLISDKNPLDVFKQASNLLNRAVAHTLGPSGANTAVVYGNTVNNGKFQIINDGKTIIDNLTSDNAEVALAMQTIRESVLSTNTYAGDGTTSTIILINSLLEQLTQQEYCKYSSFEICRNLRNIKQSLLERLPQITEQVSDRIPLSTIAETSLGSNEFVDLFIQAFDFADKNGKVLLEKVPEDRCFVEFIDGIAFNEFGFVPELVLNENGVINKKFDKCNTCIITDEIVNQNIVLDLLKQSKLSDSPILLFYQKMNNDIFRIMVGNLLKGEYKLYPISLEQLGNDIFKYSKLLEVITGEQRYNYAAHQIGNNIILGSVDGCIFTKDGIIIKPSKDKLDTVSNYISENKFLLSTKSSIIKVGAGNSILLEERFRRFEDGIYSCINALKYGVCLGGGLSYRKLANIAKNQNCLGKLENGIVEAMSSIHNQLLKNCDINSQNIEGFLPKLQQDGLYMLDKDYKAYDSYTTIEQVIKNAFDIVISIFSTKTLICDPQR